MVLCIAMPGVGPMHCYARRFQGLVLCIAMLGVSRDLLLVLLIFPVDLFSVSGSTSKASLSSTLRSELPTTATSTCKHQ